MQHMMINTPRPKNNSAMFASLPNVGPFLFHVFFVSVPQISNGHKDDGWMDGRNKEGKLSNWLV